MNGPAINKNAKRRDERALAANNSASNEITELERIKSSWSQVINESFILGRCINYIEATTITAPTPCVCWGRSFLSVGLIDGCSFNLNQNILDPEHPLLLLKPDRKLHDYFCASARLGSSNQYSKVKTMQDRDYWAPWQRRWSRSKESDVRPAIQPGSIRLGSTIPFVLYFPMTTVWIRMFLYSFRLGLWLRTSVWLRAVDRSR